MTTINQVLRGFCVVCVSTASALAQCSFSSGSTGADGAFTPTNSMPSTGWSVSNNVVTVTNSVVGVFNFTSVDIETNWTVKFTRNALNTPVRILATTNVTIKGTIDVSGTAGSSTASGFGGPGGFDGGTKPSGTLPAGNGFGPGGGIWTNSNPNVGGGGFAVKGDGPGGGTPYGTLDIQPFIGGSGGSGNNSPYDVAGGGGGGAILIASSGVIDVLGSLLANGGSTSGCNGAGGGSGGSIRLIAQFVQGEGVVSAAGGSACSGAGSYGRVRVEACSNKRVSLTSPAALFGSPNSIFLSTNPVILVTSIAGQNTPATPAGSLTVPDLNLPGGFINPATINVAASNVNAGTTFKVIVTPAYGTNVVASSTLGGVYTNSTGSVSMNVYTDRVWRVNAIIDYIPRP